MLTLYCLTLVGLLPSHHSSTPTQPCCTQLKTPVPYAQSSRFAEPGLNHSDSRTTEVALSMFRNTHISSAAGEPIDAGSGEDLVLELPAALQQATGGR